MKDRSRIKPAITRVCWAEYLVLCHRLVRYLPLAYLLLSQFTWNSDQKVGAHENGAPSPDWSGEVRDATSELMMQDLYVKERRLSCVMWDRERARSDSRDGGNGQC